MLNQKLRLERNPLDAHAALQQSRAAFYGHDETFEEYLLRMCDEDVDTTLSEVQASPGAELRYHSGIEFGEFIIPPHLVYRLDGR